MELKEIELGKDLETPVCTHTFKEGNPPQQTMDFEELEKKNVANNSSDFDETFTEMKPSILELDEEGFADPNMDYEYNNMWQNEQFNEMRNANAVFSSFY